MHRFDFVDDFQTTPDKVGFTRHEPIGVVVSKSFEY